MHRLYLQYNLSPCIMFTYIMSILRHNANLYGRQILNKTKIKK